MKVYTVYTREDNSPTAENTVLVPESFSWVSIIYPLNIIWAISNRMWLFLIILLVFAAASITLDFHDHDLSSNLFLLKVIIMLFLGFWANDFRRWSLQNRGFKLTNIVSGKNEMEAQLRYFEGLTAITSA